MMKRVLLYLFVFVFGLLAALVAYLPASLVVKQLPRIAGLQLEGVSGTVWKGSLSGLKWRGQNYGQVSWDFQPGALLGAKAEYQLRFGRGSDIKLTGKGVAGVGFSGPYLQNIVASLPAEQVMAYAPRLPVPLEVGGQLELTLNELTPGTPWCQSAKGALVWNASQVGTPLGELAMGPVIADLSCQDSKLTAEGGQQNGQLSSQFSASLTPERVYQASGWFKPGAEFPSGLAGQLSWLGNPDGEGRYPLRYSGRF